MNLRTFLKYAVPTLLLMTQVGSRVFNFNVWPFIQYKMYTFHFDQNNFYYFTFKKEDKEIPLIIYKDIQPFLPININRAVRLNMGNEEHLKQIFDYMQTRVQNNYGIQNAELKLYRTRRPIDLITHPNLQDELVYENKF